MRLLFTDRALAHLEGIGRWLREQSADRAALFAEVLERELNQLCLDLEEAFVTGSLLPRGDETASLAFSRPVFQYLLVATKSGKRVRRSSANTWRIYYALGNANSDGKPDTIHVLAVYHAASRPLWDESDFDEQFRD
jgi:plasmid stabilization system protein ParE